MRTLTKLMHVFFINDKTYLNLLVPRRLFLPHSPQTSYLPDSTMRLFGAGRTLSRADFALFFLARHWLPSQTPAESYHLIMSGLFHLSVALECHLPLLSRQVWLHLQISSETLQLTIHLSPLFFLLPLRSLLLRLSWPLLLLLLPWPLLHLLE